MKRREAKRDRINRCNSSVKILGSKTNTTLFCLQKVKWLSGEALQIAVKRNEAKSKGEKERSECRVPKNSKKR